VVIKGYQPSAKVQKGKEQTAPMSTPVTMAKLTPPKGGSGEMTLKRK
jgi:hypothetical protein